MRWYRKITSAPEGDFTPLGEALEWFEDEYETARKELNVKGRLTEAEARLPGNAEYYYGLSVELEGILKWLEIQIDKTLAKARRQYLEHYNRQLTDRMAEKYAEADPSVIDLRLLANHVALMRNKYHGITKGLEYLHFQLGNITQLYKAGIEDASL